MKYKYKSFLPSDSSQPWMRRPMVEVELIGPQDSVKILSLVDSGADHCLFNTGFAEYIGLDLEKCDKQKTVGIGGSPLDTFVTDVEMILKDVGSITIPVAFVNSESVVGLLGQIGFFDENRIKFERDHNTFEINPVNKN